MSTERGAKKAAAKKVRGGQGTDGSKVTEPVAGKTAVPHAVVIEARHKGIFSFTHAHHIVTIIQVEPGTEDRLERAAHMTAVTAKVLFPGLKVRVVCVEPVSEMPK